ncbi:hypothetical protein Mgra_00000517 [Meloidogyne graminicola]|uniref:polynucleotide adenylyltransferase n=1 Tax=Meloidogyne graminicola TaxID=189291 RepID=A0A8T0A1U6_9BILA|nr:hypothetical protein Mgra_00000517 [Meloidogyne graminicola]
MLLALSGYRANLRILELVNKNEKNFQLILLTIKVWSKNNFIYGTRFGFLGGTSISVLACHFILLNKNTSIIILIKSIFEYFLFNKIINNDETINNSFPLILEVNTNYQNIRKYLDWNSQNEFKNRSKLIPSIFHKILKNNLYPIWPIITPGFPTQNSNFNMNISTAKIIQKTIKLGNSDLNSIKIEWQNWLNGGLFKNKYSNYLLIICSYSPLSIYGNYFCDYITITFFYRNIRRYRILSFKSKKSNNWLCNIWLVGIEFNNKYLKQQIPSLERLEGLEKLEEFSERIIKGKQVLMSEWSKEIKLFNLNIFKQQRIDINYSFELKVENMKTENFSECIEICCKLQNCSAITYTGFLIKNSNNSECLLFSCFDSFNDGKCQFINGTNSEIGEGLLSIEIMKIKNNSNINKHLINNINKLNIQWQGEGKLINKTTTITPNNINKYLSSKNNNSIQNLNTWNETFPLNSKNIPVWIIGLIIVVLVVGIGILITLLISLLCYKRYRSRMRSAQFNRKKVQMLHAFNPSIN